MSFAMEDIITAAETCPCTYETFCELNGFITDRGFNTVLCCTYGGSLGLSSSSLYSRVISFGICKKSP